jgi:hypothetical protein
VLDERRQRSKEPEGGIWYGLFLIAASLFLANLMVAASVGVWRLMDP